MSVKENRKTVSWDSSQHESRWIYLTDVDISSVPGAVFLGECRCPGSPQAPAAFSTTDSGAGSGVASHFCVTLSQKYVATACLMCAAC